MTDAPPSRASVRLLVRMPLTVSIGKRSCPVLSEAIWSGGLVVRCDVPVSARQLVKLQVPIPPDGSLLALNAMVDAVRPASPGVAPALTLSLYGNGGAPVERWGNLLAEIRARFPDATTHPVVSETVTADTPDAVHRGAVRFLASFEVRAPTQEHLTTFVTRDLSRSGMFLRTRRVCAVGDELQLELVHPTSQEAFAVRCVVRRRFAEGDKLGLGVEFVGLDETRRRELWAFASSGLPAEAEADVDVELIEEE